MPADALSHAATIAPASPAAVGDARCVFYTRRRCRCGHTARQHSNGGFGRCFAAPNVCGCSKFNEKESLRWCDHHHRPAATCEREARERAAAASTTGAAGT